MFEHHRQHRDQTLRRKIDQTSREFGEDVPSRSAAASFEAVVTAVSNNYLMCSLIDENREPTGTAFPVAKPRALRHQLKLYQQLDTLTTVDAQTVDVASGDLSERWEARDPYVAFEDVAEGKTATYIIVDRLVGALGYDAESSPLDLIDANVDGRAWYQVEEDSV